jgi:hypothetical protein
MATMKNSESGALKFRQLRLVPDIDGSTELWLTYGAKQLPVTKQGKIDLLSAEEAKFTKLLQRQGIEVLLAGIIWSQTKESEVGLHLWNKDVAKAVTVVLAENREEKPYVSRYSRFSDLKRPAPQKRQPIGSPQ